MERRSKSRRLSIDGDASGEFPSLVCDTGTGMIKCGWSGEYLPRIHLPVVVGRMAAGRDSSSVSYGGDKSNQIDLVIGDDARTQSSYLRISHPMSNGVVSNWNDMEAVWDHAFRSLVGLSPEDDFLPDLSIVQTEPAFNPKQNREKMIEMMFETFKAKSVNISVQAALALCARGNRSGVVVDAGDGVTHIVPVFEGYVQTDAVRRVDVAGRQVTSRLFELIGRQCPSLDAERDFSLVQKIKETFCFVAPSSAKLVNYRRLCADTQTLTKTFILPDGSSISLGAERFLAPEVLFTPSLLGNSATSELRGISDLLLDAIASSPVDIRRPLFRSVLLSGGATLTRGLGRRLRGDLARNPHGVAVEVDESPQREFLAFRGGAAMAEMYRDVKEWWVSKADYAELGPSAVHRLIQTSN